VAVTTGALWRRPVTREPRDARALGEICAAIVGWLRPRQAEIAQAIYVRIRDAVPGPAGGLNPEYEAGSLTAVTEIVSYSLDAIEQEPGWLAPIPPAAAAQARRAAQLGVSLSRVQRRYIAGHREFGEFVMRGVERTGFLDNGRVTHHLRRTQESLLEHLMAAIEHEYNQELALMVDSPEQRRREIVRRLLACEHVEPARLVELRYDIHASWHLGLVATGARAEVVVGTLKSSLSQGLLVVPQDDGIIWVWFARSRKPAVAEIERMLPAGEQPGVSVAIGEPGQGIDGWRQTHREAQAALLVALCEPQRFARYADCHFLAAARQIDTLANALQQKYLTPLRGERDGGATLRKTLRAWVDTEGHASSAAKTLKVDRHTVENHIRTVEKLTGSPLRRSCLTELDVALRLDESM
jgi:DNA-binding PucR family transcriptional regulator